MYLVEEIFLLMLDEQSGALRPVSQRTMALALGGAALMDLQLAGRIDTDLEKLVVADPTRLGDDLLDPFLDEIAGTDTERDPFFWVEQAARRGEDVQDQVIARLVEREILIKPEEDGVLSLTPRVIRTRRYPSLDGAEQEYVTLRVMRLLFDDDLPSPEDVAIVSLANACGLFPVLLSPSELKEAQERIDLFSQMDLIGQAIIKLVQLVKPASEPEARALARDLPSAPRLPLVGNSVQMLRDCLGFLREQYQQLGPVFRIRVATDDLTVLAGPEANRFLLRKERMHLRSSETFSSSFKTVGASRLLVAMNGNDHVRMRREMRDGFSRRLITARLEDASDIARSQLAEWPLNEPLCVRDAMMRITCEQVGAVCTNTPSREHCDDLVFLSSELFGRLVPRLQGKRRLRGALGRMERLTQEMLSSHQLRSAARAPDLVDDLIELHRADPAFLAESDLQIGLLTPFLFGILTLASATSFAFFYLLKDPGLYKRAEAEAMSVLGDDPPTAEKLHELDVVRRVVMETLRILPLVPMVMKKVVTSFDFCGYRIPAGGDVYIASGVTHRLPEFFPEPDRFDIDRYLPGREEHRQPAAFAPFGLGLHRCPAGGGFAETQIELILATLLRHGVFELDRPGYELKLAQQLPWMFPHRNFRFKVTSLR